MSFDFKRVSNHNWIFTRLNLWMTVVLLTLGCWRRFVNVGDWISMLVTKRPKPSTRSWNYHQNISSPTFVTVIDVTSLWCAQVSTWKPALFFKAKMLDNSWCADPKFNAFFEYLQSDLNLIAKTEFKNEHLYLFRSKPLLSHVTTAAYTAAANITIWAAKKNFKFIFFFLFFDKVRFWTEISQ